MSRETDSSSSGPQGRGGAAYPSGTPPYGTRQYPALHPQDDRAGGEPGEPGQDDERPQPPAAREPKTETTLTTRVRINIPGSRPIPPIVQRTTVADGASGGAAEAAPGAPAGPAPDAAPAQSLPRRPVAGASGAGAGFPPPPPPASGDGDKPPASDWFSPRKPQAPAGRTDAAPGPTVPAQGSGPAPATPSPAPFGGTDPYGGQSSFGGTDPFGGQDPFAAQGSGAGRVPGHGAPGAHAQGDAAETAAFPAVGVSGVQPPPGIPYLTDKPPVPPAPFPGGAPAGAPGGSGTPFGDDAGTETVAFPGFHHPDPSLRPGPSGATTGPVTGAMRTPAGAPGGPGAGFPPPPGSGGRPGAPFGAGGGVGAGAGLSGDPAETVAEGFPAVSAPAGPSRTAPGGPSAAATAAFDTPSPAPAATPPAAPARPARKGRSKPMLLLGALVVIAAGVYGAGLVMDHADVPNGTIVLGVNIGGDSKAQAVQALNTAIGDRSTAPLKVQVGSKTAELKPELAGLSIDTQATVDGVAHRDYNPVSVVEALFGGTHQAPPSVHVDPEKLRSQLQPLTGSAGGPTDGMIKFVAGTPVAVPGKPYQAVDETAAAAKVSAAYERRAQTGVDEPVDLPVVTQQPLVTAAALQQAIKTIGDPAMSGRIVVVAGSSSIPFSPQLSLSKILTVVPVPGTGRLVLHIDLPELQSLYGNAFDGILLTRGNGSKTPVTPADVASAMLPQLSKTAALKTATIPNVAH